MSSLVVTHNEMKTNLNPKNAINNFIAMYLFYGRSAYFM